MLMSSNKDFKSFALGSAHEERRLTEALETLEIKEKKIIDFTQVLRQAAKYFIPQRMIQ